MDLEQFNKGVHSTGFGFEFVISETLRKHSWIIIDGKYYVDDRTEEVREIDIVAYKVKTVQNCKVYTVLMLVAKKMNITFGLFYRSHEMRLIQTSIGYHYTLGRIKLL